MMPNLVWAWVSVNVASLGTLPQAHYLVAKNQLPPTRSSPAIIKPGSRNTRKLGKSETWKQ
ncbi:hypothetical protein M758_10G027300 [Ceratodon purpureus]|nr:hypothetical protein M758_10G027300 [Ceratodon purpureus]